jgi:hypothetical protein
MPLKHDEHDRICRRNDRNVSCGVREMPSIFVQRTFLLAVLCGVAACTQMQQLDDWALAKAREGRGAPASGNAAAPPTSAQAAFGQCRFNPGYTKGENCCILDPYVTAQDADSAFASAVQEFQYPTKIQGRGRDPNRLYQYLTYPDRMHRAAHEVRPRSTPALAADGYWMMVGVEKGVAPGTSRVEVAYCPTPGVAIKDHSAWHQTVQRAVYATLPPVR